MCVHKVRSTETRAESFGATHLTNLLKSLFLPTFRRAAAKTEWKRAVEWTDPGRMTKVAYTVERTTIWVVEMGVSQKVDEKVDKG